MTTRLNSPTATKTWGVLSIKGSYTHYGVAYRAGGSLQMITVIHGGGGSNRMITVFHNRGVPENDYSAPRIEGYYIRNIFS